MKRWKKAIFELLSFVFSKPLSPPTDMETKLINELRNEYHGLDFIDCGIKVPIDPIWEENVKRLRNLVFNGNPRQFLRWDVIRNAMFVSFSLYIITEFMYLRRSSDWNSRWSKSIIESPVGSPIHYPFYPSSSGNLIHHAYHLAQFEEKTRAHVDRMNYIFEFGGGYGSMCRLIHNMGFDGKYIIFDLPYLSALQRYYLRSVGIRTYTSEEFSHSGNGVFCISDFETLDILLSHDKEHNQCMFIATWSVSEIPTTLRNILLPKINKFDSYLIAYQDMFGDVNNIEFFHNWKSNFEGSVLWNDWEIKHIPGNRYLVGKRHSN